MTLATSLSQALADIVGPANRTVGEQARQFAVDQATPQAVAFPATPEEVAQLLKLADERGLTVTPRGGGTAMSMGYPPERLDLVLGTRRLNQIVAHEPRDLTVTVEAGLTMAALDLKLAEHGQMLPLDTPLPHRATIGGVLASNVNGPHRLGYGGPRDRLIGIRVADAQGTLIKGGGRVVKNVAGYDLNKLFIGSLGTLGVIVEATFKLAPTPRAKATVVGGFARLEQALEAFEKVRQGYSRPVALELLNRAAFDYIAPRSGAPAMPDCEYLLAAGLAGGRASVVREEAEVHRAVVTCAGKSLLLDQAIPHAAFWRALIDLGKHEEAPASMISRTSVLYGDLAKLVHGHEALAESGGLIAALDVHLTHGVIRAAWWGEKLTPADHVMLAENVKTLRIAAANTGGAFVVESCTMPVKRAVDVWGPPGAGFPIMQRLKQQFDPHRTLSPGRFVGGI
ncbi:MAG: linked oxidase-like protein [Dehalococcoidia bacterium]|nr:linked oxidase-like protein [Dehalococcoidia bacterium]